MKKLLLCGVAAIAIAAAAPAKAEGVDLGLGGFFIGYGLYNNQDTVTAGEDLRSFDFRKETELHFNGETTLDNGLTVGAHAEVNADRNDGQTLVTTTTTSQTTAFDDNVINPDDAGTADDTLTTIASVTTTTTETENLIEESYMYLSGGWGRVNFGEEDGAAYLLQVAAPSADENIDGLRPDINSFDISEMGAATRAGDADLLDYAADATAYNNKLTYITPLFSGFQAGVSFTPSLDAEYSSADAFGENNTAGQFENGIDAAARYQGTFGAADVTLGAGYTTIGTEEDSTTVTAAGSDDRNLWNAGARVGFSGFGVGASYVKDNNGVDSDGDTTIMVAGVDYVTGPFKVGASYYDREDELNVPGVDTETDTARWALGAGYQYGPGMSLNGSVQRVTVEDADTDEDGMQVAVGTRVDF